MWQDLVSIQLICPDLFDATMFFVYISSDLDIRLVLTIMCNNWNLLNKLIIIRMIEFLI